MFFRVFDRSLKGDVKDVIVVIGQYGLVILLSNVAFVA